MATNNHPIYLHDFSFHNNNHPAEPPTSYSAVQSLETKVHKQGHIDESNSDSRRCIVAV